MTTDAAERRAGALADRYRIERELGQGGMATVYLAHDIRHDRRVALKVLRAELSAVIGAERFLAEIKTTANLQHPHILPLHDSGEVEGTVFYVMPFVEGESLRDRLTREKQLPVDDAVRIAREVGAALDYAHRQGVIHRDIKPENILLHDGSALVADFGIALAASRTGSDRMTETGMSLGTPHYMSPEQAMGERTLDARTDVYALGCVLYEMLTGEPPFSGPTAQSIVAKVMTEKPSPPSTTRDTVPEYVEDAVLAALSKLPADRPAGAAAFAAMLDGRTVRRSDRPTGLRRRPALPWIVAIVALAAAATALWRSAQAPSPHPVRLAFAIDGPMEGNFPGHGLAISADGRVIVYEGTSGGRRMLFRRGLDDLESVPIAGTEGGFQPVISPDGTEVAFASGDARIMLVPMEGGASRPVAGVTTPIGMSWSPAHGLVLGMPSFHRSIHGLSLLSPRRDTVVHPLTRPDSGMGMHHDPVVLPDGRTALYVDFPGGGRGRIAIGIASLAEGTISRSDLDVASSGIAGVSGDVLVYRGRDQHLMAVRFDPKGGRVEGRAIRVSDALGPVSDAVLAANGTLAMLLTPGPYQAVTVDPAGSSEPILPDTLSDLSARFSPDGSRVLLWGARGNAVSSWLVDLATGSRERLPTRLGSAEWSPDGRRLVAARVGREVPWVAADGTDSLTPLARFVNVRVYNARLAPEGRTLVLGTGTTEGEFDIYSGRVDGDTIAVPVVATPANEVAPRLSPDGRWLAYASDESGRFEVYVRPWPGPGPRVQVSDEGGGQPIWSGDGRQIFYRSGRIMRMADLVGAGTGLAVAGRRTLFEGDFYAADDGSPTAVYDVSPDGRRFLMGRALPGSRAEIVVWMDWLPEVKARLEGR